MDSILGCQRLRIHFFIMAVAWEGAVGDNQESHHA
jgi:hypothetical protein